ncbi:hypothetical protein LTR56_005586 [Elasticomyces elasticus]|nr:hypothetical protein LTR56_005586 [Elasticomyces elasticus]KAK3664026.1 hypothetical protein LTR22_005246 [Elasticomyces elasticus]KAK4927326.1 hypothetical protein LTR49_005731 [Elasticomyces elasticus]KAK5763292.1 hypothetical protein LTS12_006467 [Elasticomyces elasticus]
MDPVSAIGVAAAVLQFFEFSVSVLKTCKEIRDDASSATQNNKELEKAARTLEDFRSELGSVMRSKQANRRIVTIAHECAHTAKELIDLLEYVRGGDGKLGTAKATWRAMLKRKPIERMQRNLQEREAVLDKVLNQDTNTNVQALREDVRKLDLGNRSNVDQLSQKLSSVSVATNKRIGTAERNIHRRFDNVERSTQQSRDEQRQQQNHERLLSSLFFPEIDQRRSTVKAAYPDTFQWIFDVPGADLSIVPSARPTAGFGSWLRANASVHWISGKAGSGKSTLMAFILNDPRTMEALQLWSPDLPVHVLSSFFWRVGSELQKSVIGLLRSILYQLCQCIPDAVSTIVRDLDLSIARLPSWTEKLLIDAIKVVISATSNERFCIFVDGWTRLSAITMNLENAKCCVSSRPETELRAKLVECQQLRLQDLNGADIQAFVSAKMSVLPQDGDSLKHLSDRIVDQASGVFLWAVLVTQSVIRGHKSGDDWQVLYDRLKRMPKGLEALFARMVDNIDPVHRNSLAFYLQIMRLLGDRSHLLSVALLTAARDPSSTQSYSGFVVTCQQTELQVMGQSAGLLEIQSSWDVDLERDLSNTSEPGVFVPGSCKEAGRERVLAGPASVILCTQILRFESQTIHWIHRTAFEYMFPPDNNATFKPTWAGDPAESAHRLMRGATELCLFAPSFIVPDSSNLISTNGRISNIVHLSNSLICAGQITEAIHGLDELRAVLNQLHCSETPGVLNYLGRTHDRLGAAYSFWLYCFAYNLQYVLSRSEAMISDLSDTTLLTMLLFVHMDFRDIDSITVQTRILQSIQVRMQTAATRLMEPGVEVASLVIPCSAIHSNRDLDRLHDHSYVASYAPELTDIRFDARGDSEFYNQIASAAIQLLTVLKDRREGFDMATRAALRGICEQVGRVMDVIKLNVSMPTHTPHFGFEYIFTLQVPWRPLATSLLEGKRPFENDEAPEISIVYIPVTEPRQEREVREWELFHHSILLRLRHETTKLLASMLAWEGKIMPAWEGKPWTYEPSRLRICNHGMVHVDALQAMMLADVEANEQCLSEPQQHLLLTAIKTRLCEFYIDSEGMPEMAGRPESAQSHQIVI